MYGFLAGEGVREVEVVVVIVVEVVFVVVGATTVVGITLIASSLLSVCLVELSGIVTLSRSIDLTGICSCSSSSSISSISISSAVFPFVFDFDESFAAVVVDSSLSEIVAGLLASSFTWPDDDRAFGISRGGASEVTI